MERFRVVVHRHNDTFETWTIEAEDHKEATLKVELMLGGLDASVKSLDCRRIVTEEVHDGVATRTS